MTGGRQSRNDYTIGPSSGHANLWLMNSQRPLLDQVFILRFWREAADAGDHGRWRALVRNINTRQRDVVDDVQRAFAIVASNLNAAAGEHEGLEWLTNEPTKSE